MSSKEVGQKKTIKQPKGLLSVKNRFQALSFELDTPIIIVIKILQQFEVLHGRKLLYAEQFAFG